MAVTVIPFQMPEPSPIPGHLVERLRQLPADEAVRWGMELLMQIEVADVMLYERLDGEGRLRLAEVLVREGEAGAVETALGSAGFYGAPLDGASSGLAGQAFERGQSLLVMGKAAAGEASPLPPHLSRQLLGESGAGDVGFLYVLTLAEPSGRPLGALTLIRAASEGPLNHEQPNLTEAMRRLMCEILSR